LNRFAPVSQVDWDLVEADFNFNFPDRKRTVAALRRFFNGWVKKKHPAGNPNIPEWVRMAKDIQEAIISKSDAGVEIDDDDMGLEEVSGLMNRRPVEEWLMVLLLVRLLVRPKKTSEKAIQGTLPLTPALALNANTCCPNVFRKGHWHISHLNVRIVHANEPVHKNSIPNT